MLLELQLPPASFVMFGGWEESSFCCLDCNSSITEGYKEDEYHLRFIRTVVSSLHQITPLHVAAERGHTRIVEYLVSKGAEIDIQDKNGVIVHDYSSGSVILFI